MTTTPSNRDEDLLADLVARGLADLEAGRAVDPVALCGDQPHLAAELAAALGLQAALPELHARSLSDDPWLGRVLADRYELQAPLGRGAAGAVYRAHDRRLRRLVAIKLLHHGVFAGAAAEDRFLRESEVLAQHEHPHLLRIYDRGRTAAGELFLVTELLRGQGLQTLLEASRTACAGRPSAAAFARVDWLRPLLPAAELAPTWLQQIVRWIVQLGDGLAAAHRSSVFHRDVKPSNAFVRADGTAVLLDFGIAVRAGDPALTLQQAVVGTPWYMPPEQARGRAEPAPTLDVYCLCATLYHLLTLRAPHEVDADMPLALAVLDDPPPAADLHQGLLPDLQAILDKGLEREPKHRYQSIDALLADLRAFLDHRPVSVRPIGPVRRTLRHMRRHPARTTAALLGIAAVVLVAIVLPLWGVVAAAGLHQQREELFVRLPADLSIEGWPDERLLVPLDERNKAMHELDELLELDGGDLSTRLLRASERLDAGDRDGARADLAIIAARGDDPFLRAVAARYASADSSRAGIAAVDLADLPPPAQPQDFLVAGFHMLRARDPNDPSKMQRAYDLLSQAIDYLPARDLRLLALLGKGGDPDEILAEASYLEGRYGRPTGRTRHAMCVAMLRQQKWERALAYGEESLRLRPDRHGPWNNVAIAHLHLGHFEAALAHIQKAVDRRPWFENSRQTLAQILRRMERFEPARAEAGRLKQEWLREYELGNIDMYAAYCGKRAGDTAAEHELVASAARHYASAVAAAPATHRARTQKAMRYAEAFAADDVGPAFDQFLASLQDEPRSPIQLMNLAALLGELLPTPQQLQQLRLFLLNLALDLSPEDQPIRRARGELLQQIQGKR